jgi:hypothetical protein
VESQRREIAQEYEVEDRMGIILDLNILRKGCKIMPAHRVRTRGGVQSDLVRVGMWGEGVRKSNDSGIVLTYLASWVAGRSTSVFKS